MAYHTRPGLGASLTTINNFADELTRMQVAKMASSGFIIGEALAEAQQSAAELGPGCERTCAGLDLTAPAPGRKSAFDRCVDNCIAGVTDPAELARRQASCNAIMDDPELRALFPEGSTELWDRCVENPQAFMSELQNVGVPVPDRVVENVGDKAWWKKPTTWIIGAGALAAVSLLLLR
jgi:hypothetical protein